MAQQTAVSKMERTQTAVEWLSEQLRFTDKEVYAELYETIEQAKAMEQEQIKESFIIGSQWSIFSEDTPDKPIDEIAEQYYNETYKK